MGAAPIVLITGASRGIGAAIARSLAGAGARLVLTARSGAGLAAVAAELQASGASLATVAADLRERTAPDAIVAAAEAFGPIDALINNAGTAPSAKVVDTTDAMLDEVLALHVLAPFRLVRALVPAMRARGRGTLVQIASTAGLRGYPFVAAYAAAKHAMVGMTRALASELPAALRCYALCPGFVDTDITRQAAAEVARRGRHTAEEVLRQYASANAIQRLLQPEEVATVVTDLVLGRRSPATGTILDLDAEPPRELR